MSQTWTFLSLVNHKNLRSGEKSRLLCHTVTEYSAAIQWAVDQSSGGEARKITSPYAWVGSLYLFNTENLHEILQFLCRLQSQIKINTVLFLFHVFLKNFGGGDISSLIPPLHPPLSKASYSCDFLWGFVKDTVIVSPVPANLQELRDRITAAVTCWHVCGMNWIIG